MAMLRRQLISGASKHVTARAPVDTYEALADYAISHRITISAAAIQFITNGLISEGIQDIAPFALEKTASATA